MFDFQFGIGDHEVYLIDYLHFGLWARHRI